MSQAKQLQDTQDALNWHWRNSMRTVRFFSFDARAALPLPLLLVYARLSTVLLTVVFLLFFRFLENKGMTFPAAMRTFRQKIVETFWGVGRPGVIGVYKRKFKDFG
ncbi:MAG: IcmT/TraK family protein [Micavibrio sp.]|nr:IcmT/TraK family protein [Micavibrio sp.]